MNSYTLPRSPRVIQRNFAYSPCVARFSIIGSLHPRVPDSWPAIHVRRSGNFHFRRGRLFTLRRAADGDSSRRSFYLIAGIACATRRKSDGRREQNSIGHRISATHLPFWTERRREKIADYISALFSSCIRFVLKAVPVAEVRVVLHENTA